MLYLTHSIFSRPIQWLPAKWQVQWLFLVYRWVIGLYFFAWLITGGVSSQSPKFFIFLTNWSLIAWTIYLLWAALSSTFKYFKSNFYDTVSKKDRVGTEHDLENFTASPVGCCGKESNGIAWYQQIHWFLFVVGAEAAFTVMLLYWTLLYRGQRVDGVNANSHLVNGLLSLVDVLVTGTPVRFLHLIYLPMFGAVYASFTGIYYAANGTDTNGNPYIYEILDYGNTPGTAAGAVIGVVLVLSVIIHLIFYALFWIRTALSALFWRYACSNEAARNSNGSRDPLKENTDENIKVTIKM